MLNIFNIAGLLELKIVCLATVYVELLLSMVHVHVYAVACTGIRFYFVYIKTILNSQLGWLVHATYFKSNFWFTNVSYTQHFFNIISYNLGVEHLNTVET